MAKAISDEELQLRKRARRRLIGAVALVIVAIIFLPMLLDSEPRPASHDISIQIPSQSAGTFVSKIVPVTPEVPAQKQAPAAAAPPAPVPPSAPAPVPAAEAPAPQKAVPAKPVSSVPEARPGANGKPKAEAMDKPKADTKEKPKAEAKPEAKDKLKAEARDKPKPSAGPVFVVQVAALADGEKAKELQAKIAAAGVKSYTEPVATATGTVTRVRAGPFPTRAAAEQAQQKLKGMGLPGNVAAK